MSTDYCDIWRKTPRRRRWNVSPPPPVVGRGWAYPNGQQGRVFCVRSSNRSCTSCWPSNYWTVVLCIMCVPTPSAGSALESRPANNGYRSRYSPSRGSLAVIVVVRTTGLSVKCCSSRSRWSSENYYTQMRKSTRKIVRDETTRWPHRCRCSRTSVHNLILHIIILCCDYTLCARSSAF